MECKIPSAAGPWLTLILAMSPTIGVAGGGPVVQNQRVADGATLATRELVPIRVPRDLASRPVAEVVDAIRTSTGFSLRMGSEAVKRPERPAGGPPLGAGPTFWETLDPAAREARLEILPRMAQEGRRLELEPVKALPAPSTVHGAFRSSLVGLIQDRRVVYGDPFTEVPSSAIREPVRMAGTNLPSSWEQSHALILLLAEPRSLIDVELAGPPRVEEAVDDQGRSLVATPPKFENPGRYVSNRCLFGLEIRVPLDMPEPTGRSLRRFRGILPVLTWVEHPEPLEVDLTEPAGRSIRGAGVALQVIAAKPSSPAGTIRMSMKPEESARDALRTAGLFEVGPGRMFLDHAAQFEVLDPTGRRIEVDVTTESEGAPETFRVTLTPKRGAVNLVPARLRYRGLAWSRTDVRFAFDEVPLP